MGDKNARPIGEQPRHCPFEEGFRCRVQTGGSFVQDDYPRIPQKDASKGHELRLAGRQPAAADLQLRVEACAQRGKPLGKAKFIDGLPDARVGHGPVKEGQIVPNRGLKQLYVLGDYPHL